MTVQDIIMTVNDEKTCQHLEDLFNLRDFAFETKSSDKCFERMRDFYDCAKEISKDSHYTEDRSHQRFLPIAGFIEQTTESLPKDQIITIPPIEINQALIVKPEAEPEEILNYIVSVTRQMLDFNVMMRERNFSIRPFETLDLANLCSDAALYVLDIAKTHGIEGKYKSIHPGYLIDSSLYDFKGGGEHAFTILFIKGRVFLVDCTYSQFFFTKRCLIDKVGIPQVRNCYCGFFMMQNEERKKIAREIIEKGWIELKGDVLKHYLDGFSLSYRNGLFYENTGDFTFTTPYTVEDYWRFLDYIDDQVEHEGVEVLGYQYRPLKNPKMRFHK